MISKHRFSSFLPLAACAVLLGGCMTTDALNATMNDIFIEEDFNMMERNYATADFIIYQAESYVGRGNLIRMEPLTNANEPRTTSKLARLVPEQIGVRLAQLGYRVDLGDVMTAEDTNYLKPAMKEGEPADFVLGGSYVRGDDMDISLRITDVRSKRVVGAFDYRMPMNREVGSLSKAEPVIYRMQGGQPVMNAPDNPSAP